MSVNENISGCSPSLAITRSVAPGLDLRKVGGGNGAGQHHGQTEPGKGAAHGPPFVAVLVAMLRAQRRSRGLFFAALSRRVLYSTRSVWGPGCSARVFPRQSSSP